MRRLLRDVAENRPLGDTTTLADPTVVDELRDALGSSKARRADGGSTLRRVLPALAAAVFLAAAPAPCGDRARPGRERLGGARHRRRSRTTPHVWPTPTSPTSQRRALVGHMPTQVLYGERVLVLEPAAALDEDRRPRPALAARPARLPGLGPIVAARGPAGSAATAHGHRARRSSRRLRGRLRHAAAVSGAASLSCDAGRRCASAGHRRAAAPAHARRSRPQREAVPRPAVPVGRPVGVGLRLLGPDVGRLPRARDHDPARRRRPVHGRPPRLARGRAARRPDLLRHLVRRPRDDVRRRAA